MLPEPGQVVIAWAHPDIEAVHRLRRQVADDPGTAWIDARPNTGADSIAPLSQDLLDAIGCCGLRPPRRVGERHLYRALPYLRHGSVTDLLVTEAQWLTVPTLRELLQTTTIAGIRVWLLVGNAVPEEHFELFAGVTGRVLPWTAVTTYWDQRTTGAATRARACPAVTDGWWRLDAPAWPVTAADHRCPLHAGRVTCLLSAARRGLSAGTLTAARMRERLQAVNADTGMTIAELWELRDAGRDTYGPAEDALVELLPADHRFGDLHTSMLTGGGSELRLSTGAIPVPTHMRRALRRQRTTSVLCNGPGDWPLLTLFDRYVTGRP